MPNINSVGPRFPFYISGQVVKGFGRGSKQLGIPTANLESQVVNDINLNNGIYYGFSQIQVSTRPFYIVRLTHQKKLLTCHRLKSYKVTVILFQVPESEVKKNAVFSELKQIGDQRVSPIYLMCCSLGTNPYFQNETKSLEVHILNNFGYDFYGCNLRVAICGFIRGEKNFGSLSELIDAINADIEFTKQQLSNEEKWESVKNNEFFIKLV
ncbi:riboflavin kinase-like protein [Leptotrombidium deliense]|uniref:riboflavin kinase n=1 Tax=Leptotrombidium deliense TaxID=299467 RepID=A0A443SJT5_9ACAR|nr:riboflavin kinase-like protein [Leptotrombidium deliense]